MTIDEMKNKKRELGYTNEMIAEMSGVPLGTVQKIFSGETSSPRFNTLKKLEMVLGVDKYNYSINDSPMLADSGAFAVGFSGIEKMVGYMKTYNKSEYNFISTDRRIGVAAGKFKVPDDKFFYDDEITEMFEEC